MLLKPVTQEQVLEALKHIKGWKSLGPNGLQAFFLQNYWHILGSKKTRMILGFLNNGDDIYAINDTHISLVPKTKHPKVVKDFRPISLILYTSLYLKSLSISLEIA